MSKFTIPARSQAQQPFYTPSNKPTPEFVDWKAKKTASELSEAWNSWNQARLQVGKPAVLLPSNLSQAELAVLVKIILATN
jgi:hypothetical protein